MSWLIEVDRRACIGSGMCAGTAPEHFELRDGCSHPLRSPVRPADEVRDAAESCPVEAITVQDAESGEIVAPEF